MKPQKLERLIQLKHTEIETLKMGKDLDWEDVQIPEFYNKKPYVERLDILRDLIEQQGQTLPMVLNWNNDKQHYNILYDVLTWNMLMEMQVETVIAYVIQVDEQEEIELYNQLNINYGDMPKAHIEEFIQRMAEKRVAQRDDRRARLSSAMEMDLKQNGAKKVGRNIHFHALLNDKQYKAFTHTLKKLMKHDGYEDMGIALLKMSLNELNRAKNKKK